MSVDPERTFGYNWVIPNRVGRRRVNVPARDTAKGEFAMPADSTAHPDVPQVKTCTKCGETKALDEFRPEKHGKYGVRGDCRMCQNERCRLYSAAYRERNRERDADKNREYHRAYFQSHKEEFRAYAKTYRERYPERVRRQSREYRLRNLDRERARARVKYLRSKPRWAEYKHRRRARERGAEAVERFTRREIWERDRGKCHVCGKSRPMGSWHMDHIVPVSRGGQHTRQNVAVSCPSCNLRRSNTGIAQLRMFGEV